MTIQPAMNIVNYTNEIEINWNIPLFKGVPGKNITGGYKECYVRTNYSTYYEDQKILTPANGGYIKIYTQYPEAWNFSLIDESGLLKEYYDNNYIDVEINDVLINKLFNEIAKIVNEYKTRNETPINFIIISQIILKLIFLIYFNNILEGAKIKSQH